MPLSLVVPAKKMPMSSDSDAGIAACYRARPFLALPFTKISATAYTQLKNIGDIVAHVNRNPLMMKTGAQVDVIASDGDSQRRQAMLRYISHRLSETHGPQIYSLLKNLPLFDLRVGPNFEVYMLDEKHRFKRFRGALISSSRRVQVGPVSIDSNMLKSLLLATRVPQQQITSVFQVLDK